MTIFNKKFLFVTAHPDDLEMGAGGLVAKIKKSGGTATNLLLVQPSEENNEKRNKEVVIKEFAKSKNILNFDAVVYDTPLHDNGRPYLQLTNNLIAFTESVARGHDIIVSHWKEDHHQDHRVCYDVARSVARKNFEQFWCMDQPPYNLHYKKFDCNLYVDISEEIDTKRQALESYDSYFTKNQIDNIINYNKYRGSFLGDDKFAETYKIIYNKIS